MLSKNLIVDEAAAEAEVDMFISDCDQDHDHKISLHEFSSHLLTGLHMEEEGHPHLLEHHDHEAHLDTIFAGTLN